MTVTTQLVLGAPLAEPGEEKYGLQIVAAVGLRAARSTRSLPGSMARLPPVPETWRRGGYSSKPGDGHEHAARGSFLRGKAL
jgi:hypothetical protein